MAPVGIWVSLPRNLPAARDNEPSLGLSSLFAKRGGVRFLSLHSIIHAPGLGKTALGRIRNRDLTAANSQVCVKDAQNTCWELKIFSEAKIFSLVTFCFRGGDSRIRVSLCTFVCVFVCVIHVLCLRKNGVGVPMMDFFQGAKKKLL